MWSIRYTDQYGKEYREKVGPHARAVEIVEELRTAVRLSKFNPDWVKGKHEVVLFDELVKARKNEVRKQKVFMTRAFDWIVG